MKIDSGASSVLEKLHQSGFEAFIVGGCVRDIVIGIVPHDWDICTNATPEQVMGIFSHKYAVPTGLKHGTVTVLQGDAKYEVTTYRSEGGYTGNRWPSSVKFVTDLKQDLSRRDFTVNAMAYNQQEGIVDYFGGKQDIQDNILRCVGTAGERLEEDALRILRALRFMSAYGFKADKELAGSLNDKKPLLEKISAERIFLELKGVLCGKHVECVLLNYADVLCVVIPELKPAIGFKQNNPYHNKDVWGHTAAAVAACQGNNIVLRLAAFLHDIGKPSQYTVDEKGIGHFYGHQQKSADMAQEILARLKCDTKTKHSVVKLVKWHDNDIESNRIAKWIHRLGTKDFLLLLELKMADAAAKSPVKRDEQLKKLGFLKHKANALIEKGACVSLKNLAINGSDIIGEGVPEGKCVGYILECLLQDVLIGNLENEPEILNEALQKYLKNR